MQLDYPADAPLFSLAGLTVVARVVDVHDGDTIKVIAPLKMPCGGDSAPVYWKLRVRFADINAPELTAKDPEVKARAQQARARVIELITGGARTPEKLRPYLAEHPHFVTVACHDFDCFGRVLGHVWCGIVDPAQDGEGPPVPNAPVSDSLGSILLREGLCGLYTAR